MTCRTWTFFFSDLKLAYSTWWEKSNDTKVGDLDLNGHGEGLVKVSIPRNLKLEFLKFVESFRLAETLFSSVIIHRLRRSTAALPVLGHIRSYGLATILVWTKIFEKLFLLNRFINRHEMSQLWSSSHGEYTFQISTWSDTWSGSQNNLIFWISVQGFKSNLVQVCMMM